MGKDSETVIWHDPNVVIKHTLCPWKTNMTIPAFHVGVCNKIMELFMVSGKSPKKPGCFLVHAKYGAMDVSIAWIGWSNTPSQSSNWPLLTKLLRTLKDCWLRYDFTRPNGVLMGKPAILWEYTVSCYIPIYDRRLRHTKLPIISRFLPDVWWLSPHMLFLQPNVFTYKYVPFTSQLNQRCPVIAFLLAISRYIRIFSLVLGG